MWGWGSNGFGQLGDGTTEDRREPVWSSGVSVGVKGVSAGWVHSAALGVDGKAYGWGGNSSGQLGDGTLEDRTSPVAVAATEQSANEPTWESEAEQELKKIPFFVRGKARRNTEQFARNQGLSRITIKTLYDAKAHFAR
ncbi:MAG: hypothetical protein EBX59_08730 [Betaproteobacteria bacterium]|nr:hypothetical protein [Betaproteobacteria bacterium]